MKAFKEGTGVALLCFYTSALEGGEGSTSRPGRFLPPGKTRYPLYRRVGGPHGRSGRARKILPPPGSIPGPSSPYLMFIMLINKKLLRINTLTIKLLLLD
jgi:hypothetical protein